MFLGFFNTFSNDLSETVNSKAHCMAWWAWPAVVCWDCIIHKYLETCEKMKGFLWCFFFFFAQTMTGWKIFNFSYEESATWSCDLGAQSQSTEQCKQAKGKSSQISVFTWFIHKWLQTTKARADKRMQKPRKSKKVKFSVHFFSMNKLNSSNKQLLNDIQWCNKSEERSKKQIGGGRWVWDELWMRKEKKRRRKK